MRPRVRSSTVSARARAVPSRSRLTVRRSEAPLVRGEPLAAALRSSREALTELEDRLDGLLAALRGPGDSLRAAAVRVSGATSDAGAAIAALSRAGALARGR
jgi:hypothetical protein